MNLKVEQGQRHATVLVKKGQWYVNVPSCGHPGVDARKCHRELRVALAQCQGNVYLSCAVARGG
jgi:hypothetical protein